MKNSPYLDGDLTENEGVSQYKRKTCISILLFVANHWRNKNILHLCSTAVTQLQECESCSLGALFLTARLTLAFLHHHHSLLLDSGSSTAKGHNHSVSLGWGAAGARGPVAEDPRASTQPCKLRFGWDKQGAALAKTQFVVHCHCVASGCCHTLLGWQRGARLGRNITAILSVLIYLWVWKNQHFVLIWHHRS